VARICVVEDDDVTRHAICRFLEFEGHDVVSYSDARPALDEEGDFKGIDLVLTDSSMPTPASFLMEAINELGIHVPVIVMSGDFRDQDRDIYEQLGAVRLIDKHPQVMIPHFVSPPAYLTSHSRHLPWGLLRKSDCIFYTHLSK
jgi:CheY-like chemotaxis protein